MGTPATRSQEDGESLWEPEYRFLELQLLGVPAPGPEETKGPSTVSSMSLCRAQRSEYRNTGSQEGLLAIHSKEVTGPQVSSPTTPAHPGSQSPLLQNEGNDTPLGEADESTHRGGQTLPEQAPIIITTFLLSILQKRKTLSQSLPRGPQLFGTHPPALFSPEKKDV